MSDNFIRLCCKYPQLLKVVCDCHNEAIAKNPIVHKNKPFLKPVITTGCNGYPLRDLTPII